MLSLKNDFPIFSNRSTDAKGLVYLDTASSAQKPKEVIDAVNEFYSKYYSNVLRSTYHLEDRATQMFEESKQVVSEFINSTTDEIVWTMGATDALNLVARAHLELLDESSEIVISEAEHHSNILPWYELQKLTNCKIKVLPVDDNGVLIFPYDDTGYYFNQNTKVLSLTHASNVTGSITQIKPFVEAAKKVHATIVLDACQSAPHIDLDVQKLDIDFMAVSSHKLYGPTGIGFLYGKKDKLDKLPNIRVGGGTVNKVTFTKTDNLDMSIEALYKDSPFRFEAGTQPLAQIIGFAKALKYINSIGRSNIIDHEKQLSKRLLELNNIEHVRILGPISQDNRLALYSFVVDGVHPHDISQFLNEKGIAIRAGHQCAQPIHKRLGAIVSSRASVGLYNDENDIDIFLTALDEAVKYFRKR
jgi:cysteine desulfurase/selenocysteine lyase